MVTIDWNNILDNETINRIRESWQSLIIRETNRDSFYRGSMPSFRGVDFNDSQVIIDELREQDTYNLLGGKMETNQEPVGSSDIPIALDSNGEAEMHLKNTIWRNDAIYSTWQSDLKSTQTSLRDYVNRREQLLRELNTNNLEHRLRVQKIKDIEEKMSKFVPSNETLMQQLEKIKPYILELCRNFGMVYGGFNYFSVDCLQFAFIKQFDLESNGVLYTLSPFSLILNVYKNSIEYTAKPFCTYHGHFHPHVSSDGNICLGNAKEVIVKNDLAHLDKVIDYTSLIINILSQYNPDSPYSTLQDISIAYLKDLTLNEKIFYNISALNRNVSSYVNNHIIPVSEESYRTKGQDILSKLTFDESKIDALVDTAYFNMLRFDSRDDMPYTFVMEACSWIKFPDHEGADWESYDEDEDVHYLNTNEWKRYVNSIREMFYTDTRAYLETILNEGGEIKL